MERKQLANNNNGKFVIGSGSSWYGGGTGAVTIDWKCCTTSSPMKVIMKRGLPLRAREPNYNRFSKKNKINSDGNTRGEMMTVYWLVSTFE